ncbi:MAG: DNA-binding protein [Lachnospiraceae bacterium]|nr:DNA-binding protein [Lachnospiraceae bacterium]
MSSTNDKKNALTPKMLARRLSIGRDKAYALMRSAGFPSIQLGDRFIVTEEALDKWLKEAEGKHYIIEDGRFRK